MSANPERLNTLRRKFLLVLYEMSDGNASRGVQADAIGDALGLDAGETESVAQWLIDRGRARWYSMGGYIAITAAGVDQAEAFLTEAPPHAVGKSREAHAAASDTGQPDEAQYDLFVSHASEDKGFARALSEELHRRELRVWFDELQLKVGDSLREKIDHGLARSRFGVVIFSPAYFSKGWAMAELNSFIHRQHSSRRVVILPIRLDVTAQQVAEQVPLLADLYSLDASEGVKKIADDLEERVRNAAVDSPKSADQVPPVSRQLDKAIVQNLALPHSFAPSLESDERALVARAVLAGRIPASPEPVLGDAEVELLLEAVEASRLETLIEALTSNRRHAQPERCWRPVLPRSARLVTLARPRAPVRMYPEFLARGQVAVTLRPVVGQSAGGWLTLALDLVVSPPAAAEEISGTPLSLDDLHALVHGPIGAILDDVGPALLAALNDGQVEILGLGYALIPNRGGLDDYVKLSSSASRRIEAAPDPTAIHWQASTLDEVDTLERRLKTTRQLVREFFIDGGYSGFEPAIERLSDRID